MAPQNPNPQAELKSLDQQVDKITDLAGLKPIFFRLEEIARDNPNDFEIQLAVGDIKQHLVNRGVKIKQTLESGAAPITATIPMPAIGSIGGAPSSGPKTMPPPPAPSANPPAMPPAMPAAPKSAEKAPAPPPKPPSIPPPVAAPPPQPPPVSAAPPTIGPNKTAEQRPGSTPPPASPTVVIPPGPGAMPKPPAMAPPRPGAKAGPPTVGMKAPVPPAQKSAPPPAAASQGAGAGWKKPVLIGGLLGALLALGGIGFLVYNKRKGAATDTAQTGATGTGVALAVNTNPPGAALRISGDTAAGQHYNNETKCDATCALSLEPGNYQITAFLDGYEPAASGVNLTAGAPTPAALTLTLEPQQQSLRVLTDLPQGTIAIDDQPPQNLQDGQFVLEGLKPGMHTLKLASRIGDAQFGFDLENGAAPKITSPVTAHSLFAMLVTSIGNKARVTTSSGPMKLAVNGQAQGDVSSEGIDLKDYQNGVMELVVGEGKDQKNVKESYGPAPALTAFFKSDQNIGTLIVATGEDDARVFLNGKEYARHTAKGQVRIPAIGPVTVRVIKDGFEPSQQQAGEVKKGAELRMEFKLKPVAEMVSLQIRGGTAGAEVLVDGLRAGLVGSDGSYNSTVAPGDHTIELRKDGFTPKRLQRSFRAGQPVTISGADAVLVAERPTTPAAPERVTIGSNTPAAPKPTAPALRAGTMEDWESNGLWRQEDGAYVHRGAAWIPYKLPAKGTFTFTVQLQKGGNIFRSGRIRWGVNYVDAKNYALYEVDNKNFWAKVIENGKTFERTKAPHGIDSKDKSFTIQVEVMPDHVTTRIQRNGQWVQLDSWAEGGRNFSDGKFGFIIQGEDQIAISDFHFQPSR